MSVFQLFRISVFGVEQVYVYPPPNPGLAGGFILISLLLAHYHSAYWLWFTAFVGANLIQSAFSDFCPLEMILRKFEKRPKDNASRTSALA